MIKITGALLIMSSVIALSIIPLYHHSYRIRLLQDFLMDFRFIHNEMRTNLSSVPDLMKFLCRKGGKITGEAYKKIYEMICAHGAAKFQDDWCSVMKSYSKYLSSDEYDHLTNIGNILGKYILEEQLSALSHLIELFEKSLSEEKLILSEKKRIDLGIGASLGIILVILLI